jgi:hypothetical protein
MFRHIRFYFASVQSYATELYRSCCQSQFQYLLKQVMKRIKVNLLEIRNRAKIRLIAGGENSKCYLFDKPGLDLPRGKCLDAIGVPISSS